VAGGGCNFAGLCLLTPPGFDGVEGRNGKTATPPAWKKCTYKMKLVGRFISRVDTPLIGLCELCSAFHLFRAARPLVPNFRAQFDDTKIQLASSDADRLEFPPPVEELAEQRVRGVVLSVGGIRICPPRIEIHQERDP
jgi:hypothetical protein